MKRQKDILLYKTNLNAAQARARVNRLLLSQVGSQFCAGEPEPDAIKEHWRVPILFVTPGMVVGQVGEAIINLNTLELKSCTNHKQIHEAADRLRKKHHAAIKTAFIQTGKR
ncbi:MAG: hypothetical protein AB1757_17185 [Acidobacteriota bacterium]